MDSLAALPASTVPGAQAFPTAWITSGVVTPVGAAPAAAAATPTAWSPVPAFTAPAAAQGPSLLDAIADSILGPSTSGSAAELGLTSQQALAPLAPSSSSASVSSSAVLPMGAAPTVASPAPAPVAAPAAAAPAPVAAAVIAAPPASSIPAADPTRTASVSGALAGFASATGRAVASTAGAGVSRARTVGTELWAGVRSPRSIHVSQVPSKYNATPAAGNKDCGPASVVMTLRLLGKAIPGAAANAAPQGLINRVRHLAGNAVNSAATTNHELERALTAAGTKVREIADAGSIRSAVLGGKPVILNGNPRAAGAYGRSFTAAQMTPYDGAHWVVVSGFDTKAGKFIVNDPLSKVGPVKVTPAQLEAYRGGSMGIEVAA